MQPPEMNRTLPPQFLLGGSGAFPPSGTVAIANTRGTAGTKFSAIHTYLLIGGGVAVWEHVSALSQLS